MHCHSVWCICRAGEGGPQHKYGVEGKGAANYDEVLKEIKDVMCEFKTEEFMCNCAHLPLSYHRDGTFSRFTCPDCGYSPTRAQFEKDIKQFEKLSSEAQKAERKKHVALGAHWHQQLYMAPLPHFGMERIGADQLHLIYLSFFKHYFRYTVHDSLPSARSRFYCSI